jgi:hypothetical protein
MFFPSDIFGRLEKHKGGKIDKSHPEFSYGKSSVLMKSVESLLAIFTALRANTRRSEKGG